MKGKILYFNRQPTLDMVISFVCCVMKDNYSISIFLHNTGEEEGQANESGKRTSGSDVPADTTRPEKGCLFSHNN